MAVLLRSTIFSCLLLTLVIPPSTLAQSRPSDHLRDEYDLQKVVNAQVKRDGEAVISFLDSDDPAIQARAAFALASVQDSTAIAPLVDLLTSDAETQVRANAAFALGQMPGTVPSGPLLKAVANDEPEVRSLALEALGKTGDRAALRQVAELDVDAEQTNALALSIARFGLREVHDSLAVDRLITLLTESDSASVRRDAAYYFGRIQTTKPWQHRANDVRRAITEADPSDAAAMHLLLGISRLGEPEDDALIFDWLRMATDWRTRVNAARALTPRTERPAVVAALTQSLNDSIPHVARTAATVLSDATIAPSQSDALIAWVKAHPDRWRVVGPLLQSIARSSDDPVGRPFVRGIVRRYASQRSAVAHAAALPALGFLKPDRIDQALVAAASHEDPRIAAAALTAIADRWERRHAVADRLSPARVSRYFDALASGVFRGDVATINAAAPALTDSAFTTQGASGILVRTLDQLSTPDDLEGITAILRALGDVPTSDAVAAALREQTGHPHPVIRQTAASALENHTGAPVPVDGGTVETPPIDWKAAEELGRHPRLVLETNRGVVVIEMDVEQAPQTVTTLAQLAQAGEYEGVPFHRVVPNFVVQGGDVARGDGWGGPGFTIRSEFTRIPYHRGTAGIASAGKDTEGSQYFITHSMQPHLDGRYTAFGRVIDGMDVVDALLPDDRVISARILPDDEM
ncbi:peptidylprolyl isomerase [Longibacter salinarum]|uniref:peptidylprolyl isomerase n=1 Tax=Longibacter salinarum TaxID=1850348 RepID=A0A2A8CXM7_9BACT|nr:peptidylprolyl isomerase [Longibacter salinarum]PEN13128.1 peptidylprolyl isomerase [Longibacter salinarum]